MREHEKIPYDSFAQQAYWGEGMRLPGQSKGLDRVKILKKHGIDCLVVIGGDGSFNGSGAIP